LIFHILLQLPERGPGGLAGGKQFTKRAVPRFKKGIGIKHGIQ
jgi:hypothetical protein